MHKHCFQFLLGPFQLPRETEDNAYAKVLGDKQRVLWTVMVFSGVVNCTPHVIEQHVMKACWTVVLPPWREKRGQFSRSKMNATTS